MRATESTPGRRRALRALARARRRNKAKVLRGEQPVIAGKRVKISTYVHKYGKPKRTAEAMPFEIDADAEAEIEDREDVEVAVSLLSELDSDPEDLRGFVAERAQTIGCDDLIPAEWGVKPKPKALGESEADLIEGPDEAFAHPVEVVEEFVADEGEQVAEATGTASADKGPKYIFGRLNRAYDKNATPADMAHEMGAIRDRGKAKGFGGSDQSVVATYTRNLEKRIKAGIIARAKAKGLSPTADQVNATYQRHFASMVTDMVGRAASALGKGKGVAPKRQRTGPRPADPKQTPAQAKASIQKAEKNGHPMDGPAAHFAKQAGMRQAPVKAGPAKAPHPVPPSSAKRVAATEADEAEAAVISESADPGMGNVFDVLVIQPGVSKNNRRYRREVLESSTPLLNGARSFASDGPDHDPRKRGVKALVGWWSDPRYERKVELPNGRTAEGLVATYHVTDRDLASTLRESIAGGKPDLITFSIVADGEVSRVVESGRALVDVTKINAYESVDPVINAAAGGMAVRLVASVEDPSMDWARLTLAEAVKGLASGEITADDLEVNRPDLSQSLSAGQVGISESLAGVSATVAEALAPFQTERLVEGILVGHARLPEQTRTRIRETAKAKQAAEKRVLTEAEVTAIVESETQYLETIAPAVVSGSGPVVTDMKSERDRVTEAMYEIVSGKSNASFRAMYVDLTGDRDMTGRYQPSGRLSEAISTTTFDQVLGDAITRRMLEVYRLPDLNTWRDIVNVVPVSDFRTQRRIRMGGYANLPAVGQGNPYTALTTPGDEEATYAPAKKGGTESITMETIANDDLGAIRSIPTRLGRAAAQTLHEFAWDMVVTNPTIYDSTALFVAGHNNLGTAALAASTLIAGRTAMMKQADMSNAKRLGIKPKYLVVPIDLEQTAFELTQTDREVASANNTVNFIRQFGLTPIVVEYLTDTNNWFLIADKNLVPTIEMGFFNGREDPELFLQDMPNVGSVFSNDALTYKIRHIYGGAVVDFRGFYGAIVA